MYSLRGYLFLFLPPKPNEHEVVKKENVELHVKAVLKTEEPEREFTIDMALDAVLRTTSADIVCYESISNGYLMHWPKDSNVNRFGWYIMNNVIMSPLSNSTWYILDVDKIPDKTIGKDIDTTDLPCKKRK